MVPISESDWATANPITTNSYRKECEYFIYYFEFPHFPLVPSLVPSVSAACLASYNSDIISNRSASNPGWCTIECRSLYTLHSYCIGKYYADLVASYYCGSYQNIPCMLDLRITTTTSLTTFMVRAIRPLLAATRAFMPPSLWKTTAAAAIQTR